MNIPLRWIQHVAKLTLDTTMISVWVVRAFIADAAACGGIFLVVVTRWATV
jgi:hypothetical protein